MSFDIETELKKTFDEAVMSHEAKSLRTTEDWQKLVEIRDAATERINEVTERYLDEYDTRVEIVRKRLIDKAGEQNFDHPAPVGRDKFDAKAINRQAHREVQQDHERVIAQIRDDKTTTLETLKDEARQRDLPPMQTHGKAKEHFNQARDQRSGIDRRAPSRSR